MKPSVITIITVLLILSCKKDDEPSVIPDIKINTSDVIITEDASGGELKISISLSTTTENEVSVKYSTLDSTAVSEENYEAVSGTLIFKPGSKTASFNVPILQDNVDKPDLFFHIKFTDPVNGNLNGPDQLRVKIINVDYSSLIWSDEFNESSLNTDWWNYEEGNNNGWGNNELEYYTNLPENVHTDSGFLHITALETTTSSFTSGRITTLGKKEFTYGKIEIRAKMPIGRGIWPALWMLGANISTDGWPKCGEIDIMEYLGHQPELVYGTVHWDENGHKYIGGNKGLSFGNYHLDFHVFSLVWTPNRLRWLVDGQQYYEKQKKDIPYFPFDLPQFLIFNVAVGGYWPGNPDETTIFPQSMIVDYVRWYQ